MHILKTSPVALLALLCLFSCNEKASEVKIDHSKSINVPIQAEAFVARVRPLNESIEVPGTLLPFETTEIRPEIPGRIVELNIPEGKVVSKGSLLVKLFDGDLQAQLQKLQVQLSIAQKTSERQNALLKIGGISQQDADLSELAVNNLKADIELVRVSIIKTRIVAPYDGKIGLRNISNGAYVSSANVLTTISQVNNLKLDFTVPEKYSEQMNKGKQVKFSINGADRLFNATIMATESVIEADTRSLKVRAIVKGNQNMLVPGAFAKVELQPGRQGDPLVIPTQAVIPRARDKQVIVYHNKKIEFRIVKTGIRDSSYVQVTDG
ncbi:MAG: efflux RND transporter periplasmic adaptor subunit, partial [Chitinophagaceae bacterium]|nr:efflux RND transporter periplasmic adaptor subunit [Chitinophagaceae bacterium]